MSVKHAAFYVASVLIVTSSLTCLVGPCVAQQGRRPFTVADEIGLTLFDGPNGIPPEVHFSPDGNYFAVWTQRGRSDVNRVEDSLRFYRSKDVRDYFQRAQVSAPPSPIWVFTCAIDEDSCIRYSSIGRWRWLADSSGVAFIERIDNNHERLVLLDLGSKSLEPLTPTTERIEDFDLRDRQHYVYVIANQMEREQKMLAEHQAAAVIGTSRSLFELIFPNDPTTAIIAPSTRTLWAVVGGKRFEVKQDNIPISFVSDIALSPDGNSLLARLPVIEVPSSWEALYAPPYPSDFFRIHAGDSRPEHSSVHQFVRIDLRSGSVQSLTDGPVSSDAGWWADGSPDWSNDGLAVLLPGVFLRGKDGKPSRPCVAFLDLSSNTFTCVETLKGRTETEVEKGYHSIYGVHFAGGEKRRIEVVYNDHFDGSYQTTEYMRTAEGAWQVARQSKDRHGTGYEGLEVSVAQSFNEPPQLVAMNEQITRIIWDPNPQLKNLDLGETSIYIWRDNKYSRTWKGGLFKPVNYKPGQRYPLVIQTHGFVETEFRPSGVFPTAMAASELAATGIIVLQTAQPVTGGECPEVTLDEGPCAVSMYESAVRQLVSEGLVDPDRIGIIGFSRTCYYVMEMLTTSSLHLRAASISDGVMEDYFQFILYPDQVPREFNPMIGAPPVGDGLQQWLKKSPSFNLDKINTPVMITGGGPTGLLTMWGPYSGLYYLHKAVELVMLNTDEHVLTNPAVRMASQGGSVDWFRFWLQDYENPETAKAEQYVRWRDLKKLQERSQKAK